MSATAGTALRDGPEPGGTHGFDDPLAQMQRQWQFLFDNNPVPMWIFDRETLAFLAVNRIAMEHYGYTREEFLRMTIADIRPEADKAALIDAVRSVNAQSPHAAGNWRHCRKNGAIIDVDVTLSDMEYQGRPARLAQLHDVTERRAAEAALRRSHERFLALTELSADWYWEQDENLRYVEVSPYYYTVAGLPPELVLGKTRDQIYGNEGAGELVPLAGPIARREPFRDVILRYRAADGGEQVFSVSGKPIWDESGKFRGYRGTGRNITEQERMREALAHSERRTQLAIEYGKIGIWEREISSGRLHWSRNIGPMMGLDSIGETTVQEFLRLVYPEDRGCVERALSDRAAGRAGQHFLEHRVVRPDGGVRWVSHCGSMVPGPDGAPASTVGIILDITERKETEAALLKSEEMFHQLAENIPQLFWIGDPETNRILYVSPAFESLWGRPRQTLYDDPNSWKDSIHPADFPVVSAFLRRQRAGMKAQVEFRLVSPDVGLKWLWAESFPFFGSSGEKLVSGIITDITDRKQQEDARLLQALEQRDTLVGEVHHRIKNSLQGLVGLLRKYTVKHPQFTELMKGVIAQVQSVATVHGLQGLRTTQGVALCEIVQAISRMVEGVVGTPISLAGMESDRALRLAEGENVAMALILNELIMNAAKHSVGADPKISVSLAKQENGVCLEVSNPGRLPADFSFDAASNASSGLGLARALLPPQGVRMELENIGDIVRSKLYIDYPLLKSERPAS